MWIPSLRRPRPAVTCVLGVTLSLAVAGCYRPQGALMPATGAAATYWSTETQPKTVRVVDVRTSDVVFSMDIPTGKQLTLQFKEGKGDDPVYSPDLMTYDVLDLGTETGRLRNAMSVPAAWSRRIEVSLRSGIEYMSAAPEGELRTDQLADRPDWWTPAGGEMPKDPTGLTIYND